MALLPQHRFAAGAAAGLPSNGAQPIALARGLLDGNQKKLLATAIY